MVTVRHGIFTVALKNSSYTGCVLNAVLLRSFKNVKHQTASSKSSYSSHSAATMQQHLHLSRWDRLERHEAAPNLSIHKVRTVFLHSDKHTVNNEMGCHHDSALRSATAPLIQISVGALKQRTYLQ